MPALDQAIYQAELAVCGSKLNSLSVTVLSYVMDSKRVYPQRLGMAIPSPRRPSDMKVGTDDDRTLIRNYVGNINAQMQCPLSGAVDFEITKPDSNIIGNYVRWYGWQYAESKQKVYAPMRKMGDALEWVDAFGSHKFRVLAADLDAVNNWVQAAHPDKDGILFNRVLQDAPLLDDVPAVGIGNYTFSCWNRGNKPERGPIDRQFVYDDASVRRLDDEIVNDERVYPVPERGNGNSYPAMKTWLPEHGRQ